MIDVPDKEIVSVKIKSLDIKELNGEMVPQSTGIYKINIELPMNYDIHALYWYEITWSESAFFVFSNTKTITTAQLKIGEKGVHRDTLYSGSSIFHHLLDIVKCLPDRYSEFELCMQIENVCLKESLIINMEELVKKLLQTDIMHSSKYIVRFAFVVGFLCRNSSSLLYKLIDVNTAHEILDALLQKKLEDYPASCSDYMPSLCDSLFHIGYRTDFCTLLFLSRASPFLSETLLVTAVQHNILLLENFVNERPYCHELSEELCGKYLMNYLQTESMCSKTILEYLYRHLPLEMALSCFGKLNVPYETKERTEREEDIYIAITASIKSQILAFFNKTIKGQKIGILLKMATVIGKYGFNKDTNICNSIEQGVLSCFSFYTFKETVMKQEFEDFLKLAGCFISLESQLLLLKNMSESKNSSVRRLFVVLNEDDFFPEAYNYVQTDAYTSLLQNEIKSTQTRNGDQILSTFQTYCDILKLPAVSKRGEVQQALETLVYGLLCRYTLREVLLHIDKIEQLCEKEPTVLQLYKEHVQELIQKKGLSPIEVLHICSTNRSLRVNSK